MTLPHFANGFELKHRCFWGPVFLMLLCKRALCQVAERAVWSAAIVIDTPTLDVVDCIVKGFELRDVQTLVAQPPIE